MGLRSGPFPDWTIGRPIKLQWCRIISIIGTSQESLEDICIDKLSVVFSWVYIMCVFKGKLVCFILSLFVQLFLINWENVVNFLLRPFSDNSSIINILPIFQISRSLWNIKWCEHKLSVNVLENRKKSWILYLKAEVLCWPGRTMIVPYHHHFMTVPFEFLIVASNLSRIVDFSTH